MAIRRSARRAAVALIVTLVAVPGLALATATGARAAGTPPTCGTTSIPANTTGCELTGTVTPPPGPGQPASRQVGVAVTLPSPRPYPDCASAPAGTTQCVTYFTTPAITGVGVEGWAGGQAFPGGATESDQCFDLASCDVTISYLTTGTLAFPYVEVDVGYQYGTGFTLIGGGPATFPAIATASFLAPTGNVTTSGALSISSVTINPTVPSSTDAKITGTVVVTNPSADTVTGIAVGVVSKTPNIVTVSGAPKPASVASLAPGATTKVTFELRPKKSGDASLTITANGHDGGTAVTAKPRTRKFTVDGGLKLKLTVSKGPDSAGKATIKATVTNPGFAAVSGVRLTLRDATGARAAAKIGKPDPASFALGGHDSRSFTVAVHLPEVGRYQLAGTALGHVGGGDSEGHANFALARKGTEISVTVTPTFAKEQIGEKGHLSIKLTNHLNEDLSHVATTAKAIITADSGKATIGTIPAPLATVAGSATVIVPVTLTFPGKVSFRVTVSGKGATTGKAVSDTASAESTVRKPEFTVKTSTDKQFASSAMAEDFKGTGWSTAGGPIDVLVETTNLHTYTQREDFHGTVALPLWPNHTLGGQGKPGPAQGCWANFSAKQGGFRRNIKVEGKTDRLLLFADADPNLTTNMLLCEREVNYVHTTPGTAMYFSGDDETNSFGKGIKLTVIQAGHLLVNAVADAHLNVCVNLTDGLRSVTVKVVGAQLHFSVVAALCGASHIRAQSPLPAGVALGATFPGALAVTGTRRRRHRR